MDTVLNMTCWIGTTIQGLSVKKLFTGQQNTEVKGLIYTNGKLVYLDLHCIESVYNQFDIFCYEYIKSNPD